MKNWHDLGIEIPPGATGNVAVRCPWCADDRKKSRLKTLSANVELGVYNCHHCGIHGSLREAHVTSRHPAPKVYALPAPVATPKLTPAARQFLINRGISEAVAERFELYSERVWMPQVEGETPTIAYPYVRSGVTVNVKYRDAKKNFRMVKDAEKILYNLDGCAGADTVAICEGEMDVLALATAGWGAGLSVPNGAPPADAQHPNMDYLASGEAVFAAAKKIILAVDNDGPGKQLETELARRIGREKCWRVRWPDGSKDANDVLVKHGAERLMACLDAAEPYPVEGIVTVREVEDEVWSLYVDGLPRGTSTGWTNVDRHYTVQPGQFTVVTGIPGSGKSAWVDNLCVNLAVLHGWCVGVCSPENHPVARHIAGLAAKHNQMPFADGPTPRMGAEDLDTSLTFIHEHFAFILPDEPTLTAILDRARVLVLRMGIRGLVIDPWNELDHSRPSGLTETEYISQSLTRIRQFARHYGVHVWVVVHPTKLIKGADGQYPVPTLYDCAGSAHWYNKADNGLSVWRDKRDVTAASELHVQKVRFSEVGGIGVAQLHYDLPTGRYRDVLFSASAREAVVA